MIGFHRKDQDMTKQAKLIERFAKINDTYSITNCQNGFLLEVSGEDSNEKWITHKYVVKTVEELQGLVEELATMPI